MRPPGLPIRTPALECIICRCLGVKPKGTGTYHEHAARRLFERNPWHIINYSSSLNAFDDLNRFTHLFSNYKGWGKTNDMSVCLLGYKTILSHLKADVQASLPLIGVVTTALRRPFPHLFDKR